MLTVVALAFAGLLVLASAAWGYARGFRNGERETLRRLDDE